MSIRTYRYVLLLTGLKDGIQMAEERKSITDMFQRVVIHPL